MFAVGHLALGYLAGKATSKLLNLDMNIPLILTASVLADIDFLVPGMVHRGPTHSIILLTLLAMPALIRYKKGALPYYVALIQHITIGDLLTGRQGIQLLWPITMDSYGLGMCIESLTSVSLEWIFFIGCIAIMLKTKDAQILFQSHRSNLILALPTAALLLPMLFGLPWYVPSELIVPHLTYVAIFTISILKDLITIMRKT